MLTKKLSTELGSTTLPKVFVKSERVALPGNLWTTVHTARYRRSTLRARCVVFDEPTILKHWCEQNGYREAISGGFRNRDTNLQLGELWINGQQLKSEPFTKGWASQRGSVLTGVNGDIVLAKRPQLPIAPNGDLLEAGPMLVIDGQSTFADNPDPEGFSETFAQHDANINGKRHPRAAIATNNDWVWSVVVDGRSPTDAGMYLPELADYLISLGAHSALNLDGGRSANLISAGRLINTPRAATTRPGIGFGITSAIVFELI